LLPANYANGKLRFAMPLLRAGFCIGDGLALFEIFSEGESGNWDGTRDDQNREIGYLIKIENQKKGDKEQIDEVVDQQFNPQSPARFGIRFCSRPDKIVVKDDYEGERD